MSYEELWKTLDDLSMALQRKGKAIPAEIKNDLRSAKTLLETLKVNPNRHENIPRIERYLENVEFHLLFLAQESFGSEYVERWVERIKRAHSKVYEENREIR